MQQAIKHFEVYELFKMTPDRISILFSIIFFFHHFSWHFKIVPLFGSYWGFSVFVSNFSAVSRLPELMVKGMVGRHIQLTINSQSSVNLDTWEKVFKLKQFSYIHYKGVNSCCKCGVYKGVNSCCKCSEVNDLNNLTTHVPQVMLLFLG